jgi:hypothetical protein
MRNALTLLAVLAATLPAAAFGGVPDPTAPVATEHAREAAYADDSPRYPMNYSDEAAQRLGVEDGHWEAFHTQPSSPLEPSLNAGVDSGGAMLRLQWH